jgi:hypothetical protein
VNHHAGKHLPERQETADMNFILEADLSANHQQLDWLNARQTQNKEVGATGLEPVTFAV